MRRKKKALPEPKMVFLKKGVPKKLLFPFYLKERLVIGTINLVVAMSFVKFLIASFFKQVLTAW